MIWFKSSNSCFSWRVSSEGCFCMICLTLSCICRTEWLCFEALGLEDCGVLCLGTGDLELATRWVELVFFEWPLDLWEESWCFLWPAGLGDLEWVHACCGDLALLALLLTELWYWWLDFVVFIGVLPGFFMTEVEKNPASDSMYGGSTVLLIQCWAKFLMAPLFLLKETFLSSPHMSAMVTLVIDIIRFHVLCIFTIAKSFA